MFCDWHTLLVWGLQLSELHISDTAITAEGVAVLALAAADAGYLNFGLCA